MEIIERLKSPTPKFWKNVRNICGGVIAVSAVILALPVALPSALITIAGYAGAIATAGATLAQATKEDGEIDLSKLDIDQLTELRDKLAKQLRPLSGEEKAALLHISKLIANAGASK